MTEKLFSLFFKSGGARRDRTADLLRARQALSQLSYGPYLTRLFCRHICYALKKLAT